MSSMLTTIDNPFNPFTEFDKWYSWDVSHGYNSCSYLMRIAKTSDSLSDELNADEIERAIDEIVDVNINGRYMKFNENDQVKPVEFVGK